MCDKVARAIRDRDEEKSYETERRQRTVLRGRGRNERLTKFALCRERERVSHFQKSDTALLDIFGLFQPNSSFLQKLSFSEVLD